MEMSLAVTPSFTGPYIQTHLLNSLETLEKGSLVEREDSFPWNFGAIKDNCWRNEFIFPMGVNEADINFLKLEIFLETNFQNSIDNS